MEAYTLIHAGKFRYKLCFFFVKNKFYGSRLYYVVKYSMNKLGNIHSVTNLAHLFPFIQKKKKPPKDLERKSMGHKTYFTFLYWPICYFHSLKNKGSLFYLTTKNTLPAFGEIHPTCTEKWMSLMRLTVIKIGMIWKIWIRTLQYQIEFIQQLFICYMQKDRWQS